MKLKKIASLMLAGIMAVSMLAACGEGKKDDSSSSSSENPVASSFTEAVLAEASKATRDNVSVDSDDTMDKAVEWAAKNNDYNTARGDLFMLPATSALVVDANTVMDDMAGYTATELENWSFVNNTSDETFWMMYIVDAKRGDDWIAKELAEKLNDACDDATQDNCEYTVRIAKANVSTNKDASFSGSVLIGIEITVDNTTNNK